MGYKDMDNTLPIYVFQLSLGVKLYSRNASVDLV